MALFRSDLGERFGSKLRRVQAGPEAARHATRARGMALSREVARSRNAVGGAGGAVRLALQRESVDCLASVSCGFYGSDRLRESSAG